MKPSGDDPSAIRASEKTSLKFVYISTIILLILTAGVSMAGLVFPEVLYPDEKIRTDFVLMDMLNLILGLPILLVPMILTRKQKLLGLLAYPGALLYISYIYAAYLLGLPFNILFVPYLILVVLGIYSIIVLMAAIEYEQIRDRLKDHVPVRGTGILLIIIAGIIIIYQIYAILHALVAQTEATRMMIAQWIDDLLIGIPPVLITGILMIQRRAMAYVAGFAMLYVLSMLFIGLLPLIIFEGILNQAPINLFDLVVVAVSSLICIIPLVRYASGIRKVT